MLPDTTRAEQIANMLFLSHRSHWLLVSTADYLLKQEAELQEKQVDFHTFGCFPCVANMGGKFSKKGFCFLYERPIAHQVEEAIEAVAEECEDTPPAAATNFLKNEKSNKDFQVPADEIEDVEREGDSLMGSEQPDVLLKQDSADATVGAFRDGPLPGSASTKTTVKIELTGKYLKRCLFHKAPLYQGH